MFHLISNNRNNFAQNVQTKELLTSVERNEGDAGIMYKMMEL